MLIIPNKKIISHVSQLEELKELKRNIIIYDIQSLDSDIKLNNFALINNSVQIGSIGVLQTKTETLYSINCYYGTIDNPFIINPTTGKIDININSGVRISDNGYVYKLIDTSGLRPEVHTVNWFTGEFFDDYITYKNSSPINHYPILPSDPRYYNLDHQIKMTDSDDAFYLKDDHPTESIIAGEGIPFNLSDLIDDYTTIKAIRLKIDDPYKLAEKNSELQYRVLYIMSTILNYGILTMAKTFNLIMDTKYGFNVTNLKRSFNVMEKEYERDQVREFYHIIDYEFSSLKEDGFNVRIQLVFNEFKTYLQILPAEIKSVIGEQSFSRNDVEKYIEYNYNDARLS